MLWPLWPLSEEQLINTIKRTVALLLIMLICIKSSMSDLKTQNSRLFPKYTLINIPISQINHKCWLALWYDCSCSCRVTSRSTVYHTTTSVQQQAPRAVCRYQTWEEIYCSSRSIIQQPLSPVWNAVKVWTGTQCSPAQRGGSMAPLTQLHVSYTFCNVQ